MNPTLLVFLGGGMGAMLRYGIGVALVSVSQTFPWATFLINIIGSLLIGMCASVLPVDEAGHSWRLLLMTGVLGGFTTFSAFSLETAGLWEGGAYASAALYVAGSLLCCLTAVALGLWLGKILA